MIYFFINFFIEPGIDLFSKISRKADAITFLFWQFRYRL